ncbi:hypothetical protein [endosymbiont GvMRE of Glomus versiforme]|uniref:hypothetical protein n=1 Tax=endosymbiont GvMRE of Glomus versiforme TaxID=2039283 RepID=UPI000EDCA7EE|nr:hypothetical protein [endosymbiont GvMRE of Glomus versiforme]RHZ36869.1 hypothetical protein GvMRE_I2g57 [endosymbiont GvMRE of Glomus versiforme]
MNPDILPSEIKQFRNYWKNKVENELGTGIWCEDPNKKPKIDPSKYTKLLEKAQKERLDVKFTGKFASSGRFNIRENWLEATEIPWNLKIALATPKENKPDSENDPNHPRDLTKPPIIPNVPLKSNSMNFTPSTEHDCPYLKLPELEARFQQKYQAELDSLKASELNLINERNNSNQELQQTKQEIKNICEYWGANNLTELNEVIREKTRRENEYQNERNNLQNQIRELTEKINNQQTQYQKLEKNFQQFLRILEGDGEGIKNHEHLKQILGNKSIYQIIQERNQAQEEINRINGEIQQLLIRHKVNTLQELSLFITKKEEELAEERNWWNEWINDHKPLSIKTKQDLGVKFYSLIIKKISVNDDFWTIEEKSNEKARKAVKLIYEHYIQRDEEIDDQSLAALEIKIASLIGQDFTPEQITELRNLFIANKLTKTYEFIEEVTSLTNNHKIKRLENKSQELKHNLDENTGEELKEKANTLTPLLEACALPETREFIFNGFTEWAKLLEMLDDGDEN